MTKYLKKDNVIYPLAWLKDNYKLQERLCKMEQLAKQNKKLPDILKRIDELRETLIRC